ALVGALALFGAGFGAVNVAGNAQGIALERAYGRSILSSFHAAFSAGGLIGAAAGALAAARGVEPSAHFAAVAVTLALVALGAGRLLPRAEAGCGTFSLVRPPRALLLLGGAAFFTLLAEGAAADWSAVYLRGSLGSTTAFAALGYTAFSLAMVASRLAGDRLDETIGPTALAGGGGMVSAVGLAAALAIGTTPAALVGFAAMGAGLGVMVPVIFRTAGTTPGVAPGIGIAAVSTIGFLGVLAAGHGRRSIDLIRLVAPHLDAEAEAADVEREEIAQTSGLRPLPGARDLVDAVPAERFAIVTSGSRALALARLRAAGLPVPDVLVTAEE